MREVAIIGIGQTPVDEHWDKSLRELATKAILAALRDAQRERVDGIFVGNMMSGILSRQENLGALIADWAGLRGVEVFKVKAACGSGAAVVHLGVMAIASGHMDSVIVMGAEKMTETAMAETTAALATAADADFEGDHGVSFVSLNVLIMQRYLYEYKWKHTDFAQFSINAHENAMCNPNARLQDRISVAEYGNARMICDPINLLDASPTWDGAAALVLVPLESLRSNGSPRIVIAGSTAATDSIAIMIEKIVFGFRQLILLRAKHMDKPASSQKTLIFLNCTMPFPLWQHYPWRHVVSQGAARTAPCLGWGNLPNWTYSYCHARWIESARSSSWSNRGIPDR